MTWVAGPGALVQAGVECSAPTPAPTAAATPVYWNGSRGLVPDVMATASSDGRRRKRGLGSWREGTPPLWGAAARGHRGDMKIAVVYESMFGNTETLAGAVARGLRERGAEVVVMRAGEPLDHDLAGLDLLVLAAPTHALTLSRPASRAAAVSQGAETADASTGLREWLDAAGDGDRPPVAVFDTRVSKVRHWPGAASHAAARSLRRMGFTVVDRTSFFVDDVRGPLVEGEVERARVWGYGVAAPVVTV